MTLTVTVTFANEDDFARMLGFADMDEARDVFENPTPEQMIQDLHVPWTLTPTVVAVSDEPNVGPIVYPKNTKRALINDHYGLGWTVGILLVYLEDQGHMYFDRDTIEMIHDGLWWFAENVLRVQNVQWYGDFIGACG